MDGMSNRDCMPSSMPSSMLEIMLESMLEIILEKHGPETKKHVFCKAIRNQDCRVWIEAALGTSRIEATGAG